MCKFSPPRPDLPHHSIGAARPPAGPPPLPAHPSPPAPRRTGAPGLAMGESLPGTNRGSHPYSRQGRGRRGVCMRLTAGRGLCSRPCRGRSVPLAQRLPREQRGRHRRRGRTDFWELPSEQATFQHTHSPSSGEKRGQDTKTVHLYQVHRVYTEAATPRRTIPRGALGCCQPCFAPRWQAARSISCDAGERHRTQGLAAIGRVQRHPRRHRRPRCPSQGAPGSADPTGGSCSAREREHPGGSA